LEIAANALHFKFLICNRAFSCALQVLSDVNLIASSLRQLLCDLLLDLYFAPDGAAVLKALSLVLPHFLISLASLLSSLWSSLCAVITLGIIVLVMSCLIFFTEPPIGVAPNALLPSMRSVIAASISAYVFGSVAATVALLVSATTGVGPASAANTQFANTKMTFFIAIESSLSGGSTQLFLSEE
jgi:hypothetical protein